MRILLLINRLLGFRIKFIQLRQLLVAELVKVSLSQRSADLLSCLDPLQSQLLGEVYGVFLKFQGKL